MATAAAAAKAPAKGGPKEINFAWEGKDKAGKTVRGETRGVSENVVQAALRRQVTRGLHGRDLRRHVGQDDHRELEPLGLVHGHQPHAVAAFFDKISFSV